MCVLIWDAAFINYAIWGSSVVRWLAITEFWGPFVWFQRGEIVRERLEEYKKSLEMIHEQNHKT